MKRIISVFSVFVAITFLFCDSVLSKDASNQANENSVRVEIGKSQYVLGEIVPITIVISNETTKDAFVRETANAWGGQILIYIGKPEGEFKLYRSLSSRGKNRIEEKLFCCDGDGIDGAKNVYAFDEAGIYLIKAIFKSGIPEGHTVESDSVGFYLTPPSGTDLVIWEEMKKNKELVWFIHFNSAMGEGRRGRVNFALGEGVPYDDGPTTSELVTDFIKRLISTHSNSPSILLNQAQVALDNYEKRIRQQ